jgi:hypothetical protein
MYYKKILRISVVFVFLILLSSCTKEKAEALQLAAEQFRVDAVSAIDQINYLFLQDISIAQPSDEEQKETVVQILQKKDKKYLTNDVLNKIAKRADRGKSAATVTNAQLDTLKAQYYQFENMFSSLVKGSYFAKDAVNKAEKHAVNLTLQLINFARILQNGDFTFSASRAAILTKMHKAVDEPNEALQQEYFNNLATEFIQLLKDEKAAKENAIRQCYKAAESGNITLELIRNYDNLTVADIMNTIKGSLKFAAEITNGNQSIVDLTTKFDGVEKMIKENPDYQDLLSKQFKPTSKN